MLIDTPWQKKLHQCNLDYTFLEVASYLSFQMVNVLTITNFWEQRKNASGDRNSQAVFY